MVDGRSNLPVTVFARARECFVDVGSLEVRQCDDGTSSHRWFVIERAKDRRTSPVVTNGTKRRDCGFATPRVLVTRRNDAQLLDGPNEEVLTEREDGTVNDERVVIIETAHERSEDVLVVQFRVSDLIQCLTSNVDVHVAQGAQPVIGGDEVLANHSTKRQDPMSRDRALRVGAQDIGKVVT